MSALHALLLELVAGRQKCQPRPNSQQQTLTLFLSSFALLHTVTNAISL